jgi:hypothetical protein
VSTISTIVIVLAAAWIGFSAYSVFAHKSYTVDNFVDYGVPPTWWPWLGAAKTAGAAGLLAGLWVPAIGIAAAIGLTVYFLGAVVTVLRARAFAHVPFPLLYLAPVVAAGVMTAGA